MKEKPSRNVPNWVANPDDYELVFMPVKEPDSDLMIWREVGHILPEYANMTLADYLAKMSLFIPDYCQFMRVLHPDYNLEYRAFGSRVRIDFTKREFISKIG